MKQLLLLLTMLVLGGAGAFVHPFWGLLLYYTFAVLRPQHLWKWALPDVRWSLLAAGAVVLGVAVNLPRVTVRGRVNPVAVLLFAYGCWVILSVLAATSPAAAAGWTQEYLKVLVIALIASVVIDRLWQVEALAAMVLVAIGYIAWEINSLYVFDGRLDIFHYGYGGLDNNGAGLMLAMGIPFAYAFGTAAPRRWQRAAAWGAAVLILHAMLMSYSRGAMVAAIAGGLWLLWHHRPRAHAAALAAAACVAVALLAGPEIRERFVSSTRVEQDSSINSRFESWSAAWAMTWDHPFTGQGVRNANLYSQNYGADQLGRTIHNQYLQIAADSGVPAAALYIAMLATAMVFLSRVRRRCGEALESERLAAGPAADGGHRGGAAHARPLDPHSGPPPAPGRAAGLDEIRRASQVALACQASLITFMLGGVFLSLEVFELPWLLVVLAGVMPGVLEARLAEMQDVAEGPSPQSSPSEGRGGADRDHLIHHRTGAAHA